MRAGKISAAIGEVYRDSYNTIVLLLAIFGIVATVIFILFPDHSRAIAGITLAALALIVAWPVAAGVTRSFASDDVLAPPEAVREFCAVSYAATSDADMKELTRFAIQQFGETFPAEVDAGAVRKGAALGLRLTDEKGRNIGFLDTYHFRDDILALWRRGEMDENTMTLDQFVPIREVADPADSDLNLVLGALYIDTSNPVATYHLAYGLIEAAKEYLRYGLRDFRSVNIFATIFSPAGRRWAQKEGFVLDILGGKRGGAGGGHDLFVLNFKPGGPSPRESFSIFGNNCEYRIRLRLQ